MMKKFFIRVNVTLCVADNTNSNGNHFLLLIVCPIVVISDIYMDHAMFLPVMFCTYNYQGKKKKKSCEYIKYRIKLY